VPALETGGSFLGFANTSQAFQAGELATNGFREDIGSFMLVGIAIAAAGCWELTSRYGHAELSYVVTIER
jgi:hypothetical protein